jgi:hypothetical protein
MKDKTVAILESRARDQIADLARKHGGHLSWRRRWPKSRMLILRISVN